MRQMQFEVSARKGLASLFQTAFTIIAVWSFLAFTIAPAQAQSATATPESEEITRLREQKTRIELEKDIAVAEKDKAAAEKGKLEAQFPKPSTSPLAGETKINDGAVIESDMVSYYSMANAANNIVKALRNSKVPINTLAIYSKPDIDLLLNYNVTTNQIELVRQQYCKLLRQDPLRCPGVATQRSGDSKMFRSLSLPTTIAGSLLGSFVDMTALLRTNVTVQGHTFEIAEPALVSEVFRAIRSKGGLENNPNLFYPAAFPPNINVNTTSQILGQFEVLYDLKARTSSLMAGLDDNLKKTKKTAAKIEELEVAIKKIKQDQVSVQNELNTLVQSQRVYGRRTPFEAHRRMQELRKLLADLSTDLFRTHKDLDAKKADLKALEQKQAALLAELAIDLETADVEETLAKLKLLNDRFDQLVATLIKVDGATGINSLTAYIKAENLKGALNGNGYWLQLAVVKAGGNNRIKTNLVTDIFTAGNRISHSGGVIVQFNLYDLNGRSLVSDTLTEYAGYIKSGKIKQLPNPANVDEAAPQRGNNLASRKTPSRNTSNGRGQ